MPTYPWSHFRQPVLDTLHQYLAHQVELFPRLEPWTSDVAQRVEAFVDGGKTVRGCLVGWMAELLGAADDSAVLQVGAAAELMHAALLIHDDILDQDELRHGQPSLFKQYQLQAEAKTFRQPRHYGESMAICVGDMALFWGNDLLSSNQLTLEQQLGLNQAFNQNLIATGLAEMMDTDAGFDTHLFDPQTAETISLYKTARYTFCMPFAAAAVLTNQSNSVKRTLDQLGEVIGLLFQTRDDYLGLFGETSTTGKPVGADLKEGKKTLYSTLLYQKLPPADRQHLLQILGNEVKTEDYQWVVKRLEALEIVTEIESRMSEWRAEGETLISQLPLPAPRQQLLLDLLHFVAKRQK